jgi:hypothetical protein
VGGEQYPGGGGHTYAREFLESWVNRDFCAPILAAKTPEQRTEIAQSFACGRGVYPSLVRFLLFHIEQTRASRSARDANLLLKYADIAMTTNIEYGGRFTMTRMGLSVAYRRNSDVLYMRGHAIDEGLTEYLTLLMVAEHFGDDMDESKFASNLRVDASSAYVLETKLVGELARRFGIRLLVAAKLEDESILMNEVDKVLGEGSYIRLLQLMDKPDWPQAFRLARRMFQ